MVDRLRLPLSRTAQVLLAAERALAFDEALKARALARAQAALEGERLSGVSLRLLERPAGPRVRSRVARTAILLAAALGVAGLAAGSVQLVANHSADVAASRPPTVPPIRIKAPALVPHAASQPEDDAAAPVASAAAGVTANTAAHTRPGAAQKYATELGLLEPARTSSARGDYNAALLAIAKHEREFPNGQLAEEREALRVRALWGVGQRPAAEAAAAAFRARYPRSGLLAWMKRQQPQ